MAMEPSTSISSSTTTTTKSGGGGGGGGSTDSYVGSLISLTSKSDIRYEGILFTINTLEATIGLRNVRSFGTEGRRMDGQVPASDKIYEYIVFRGSDIKDLQVKSSPPVQTTPSPPVYNNPAIIQSQHSAPTASSNLPTASVSGPGSLSDSGNQMSQPGPPLTTYPNSVPMYPPVGNMPQWNPSPTTTASGNSMAMYWQGYYNPSAPLQVQQQPLLRPVQGLSVPPPMQPPSNQQLGQYPITNASTGASDIAVPQSVEPPPPLLQPSISSSPPMQTSVHPVQPSALSADPSNLMSSKAPGHVASVVPQSTNSPMMSTMLPKVLDKSTVAPLFAYQAKPMSSTSLAFNGLSESLSADVGNSTSPALVTPGQFLQPRPTISSNGQAEMKDIEVVQVSSLLQQPQSSTILAAATEAVTVPVSTESQGPLLPIPSPSNARMYGVPSQTRYTHQAGRDQRRGNEFFHPVGNFSEEFDFEAMNEKFNKDEVWGHLGKSKVKADGGLDFQDEEDVDVPGVDVKPVYKKDDFFDTLSSNALDRENRTGRTRFSEQMRLDTETFGNFQRNRGFQGGRGPGGGRSRGGGYYGRGNVHGYGYGYGYGNVGRGGRGNSVYRAF